MSHQRTFHFEWADAVTGTLDYVVCTTDKPKVAVLVFPGNIAGVINTIVPSFMSAFRIPVVFFEKSERFTFAGADYNLSLFTRFNRATFMVDQPVWWATSLPSLSVNVNSSPSCQIPIMFQS